MEAYAMVEHIRLSPFKTRLVADLVRGKRLEQAIAILESLPNRPAVAIRTVLLSAAANAENNFKMSRDALYVSKILIDGQGGVKRVSPRGMGRADVIRKPLSRIYICVAEKEEA
ncbi:MAG: 50S ribosomal protein L22 [Caldisericota bacterium]|jgi:large subunit ribosomal protein L22|nr:50S ribosomal protein L22 [Caldisericota bacterium]